MQIKPLDGCFGAEVSKVDLRTVDDSAFAAIEAAFYDYSVLVFHDQALTEQEHIAFSERFGALEATMVNDPSGGGGPINHISNLDANGHVIPPDDPDMVYNSGNSLWHTDSSYKSIPAKASLLAAVRVPSTGGETEFACMRAAYRELSQQERDQIDDLVVEHDLAYSRGTIDPTIMHEQFRNEVPPVQQALVRTLRESGRKTYYAGAHAARVVGWPEAAGRALIDRLNSLTTQPQFVYRHRWRVGDLVMWDNRCCLHRGRPWDSTNQARVMRRTTIAGAGSTLDGH